MVKKIRNSLSAKVFLWIAGLLILCSLSIYGMVMVFLPQSYTVVASSRVESEIQQLTESLSNADFADSREILDQFSRENQALVVLAGVGESQSFGSLVEGNGENILTTSLEITFADRADSYTLSITAPVSPGRELTVAFIKNVSSLNAADSVHLRIGCLPVQSGVGAACIGNQPHFQTDGSSGYDLGLQGKSYR